MTEPEIPFKEGCNHCEGKIGMPTQLCPAHYNRMMAWLKRGEEQFTLPPCGECGSPSKIRMSFYGIEPFNLWFCSTECVTDHAW